MHTRANFGKLPFKATRYPTGESSFQSPKTGRSPVPDSSSIELAERRGREPRNDPFHGELDLGGSNNQDIAGRAAQSPLNPASQSEDDVGVMPLFAGIDHFEFDFDQISNNPDFGDLNDSMKQGPAQHDGSLDMREGTIHRSFHRENHNVKNYLSATGLSRTLTDAYQDEIYDPRS